MQKTVEKTTSVELGVTKTSENFKVTTNLKGKEEAFKMLALAEATNLPLLFQGVPGTGKTALVRDYGNARVAGGSKLFILELDEDTKPAEVKGRPNMSKLVHKDNPVYEVISPIAEADYIVMNEIDKANSGMRNSMLSIMAEHKLFNGEKTVDLPYKVFVGTCNQIPNDEKTDPFWDRFILKHIVSRLTIEQLGDYFNSGHKGFRQEIEIRVPTQEYMMSKTGKGIPGYKMTKLIDACYSRCSDRTLSFLPILVKAVSYIWNCNVNQALVKTASILTDTTIASALADQLTTKEVQQVMNRIDMINGITDPAALKRLVHEVNVMVVNYTKDNKFTKDHITEVEEALSNVLNSKGVNIAELQASLGKK